MLKCPFCHFDNEDGALFCEQCKSDLGGVEPAFAAPPLATPAAPAVEVPAEAEAAPFVPDAAPYLESVVAEAAPLAEFAPAPAVLEQPAVNPAPAPQPDVSPAPAAIADATVAEPAAITMPASTIPPPGSFAPVGLAPAIPEAGTLPPDAQPRLLVLRGQKRNVEYPIYDGHNFIGRADEKPVDIDLEDQEPPDRIWCSRQHALIAFEEHHLIIEDLNSANGTFVNRSRIYPGQKRPLNVNDVIQIGNVQLKVIV
jgi:hypothetical protein